jgi:hypothetical protein
LLLIGCAADATLPPTGGGGSGAPSGSAPGTTEPSTGAASKPSEQPSATRWMQPPAASPNACCDVGALQGLDDPDSQASPPSVAWNGERWTVTWADFDGHAPWSARTPTVRAVDGNGDPAGDRLTLSGPAAQPMAGIPTAVGWGGDRFALVAATPAGFRTPALDALVLLVDEQGALREFRAIDRAGGGGALTRLATGWAVLTYDDPDGGTSGSSRLVVLDDGLRPAGREIDLGRSLYADFQSVAVIAVGDRLVTVQATDGGIRVRTFVGRALEEPAGLASVIPAGSSENPSVPRDRTGAPIGAAIAPIATVGAGRLRDRVIIAATDRASVRTWAFDPFSGAVSGPNTVGTSTAYRSPAVSGDDVGGTAGICFTDGPDSRRDADSLRFSLVGPDGQPRGEPITIATGLRYVASCAVSAGAPDEYLVALWNAAKDFTMVRPSILVARVQVRREPTEEGR